jgi:dTDP-4-dehydrorhamnose 3,5-epimerase
MMFYQMPEFYDPQFERGVRWNDPAFGIDWPERQPSLNERDARYPDFKC